MLSSVLPLLTAGSQFPSLLRQQVLDELEVSGRVSTFLHAVEGAVLGLHLVLRNQRMASRLCHNVFLQPMLLCLQEDLPHKASQGEDPILYWPPSELGSGAALLLDPLDD